MNLSYRSATADDLPFLLELRLQTMDLYLAASGSQLDEAGHQARVLDCYEHAAIILHNSAPIGLLKVLRNPGEWKVLQLQISPEWQGKGVGRQVLDALIAEAKAAGAELRLTVLKVNPARSLYERLGFVIEGETEGEIEQEFLMRYQV